MKKQPYPVALEGIPYILISFILAIIFYFFIPYVSFILLLITIFIVFFFRNPKREIPKENNLILAPADGVILDIKEIEEEHFIKGKAVKVSIFLSIFNVHINRAPIEGEVKYLSYRKGKFLPAFKSHASEINEKNYIGIENQSLKILVTQITGFIARRIVCWVNLGEYVNKGESFGMIKFGSCTEIVMPKNIILYVKKGDKVCGGETIIGTLEDKC